MLFAAPAGGHTLAKVLGHALPRLLFGRVLFAGVVTAAALVQPTFYVYCPWVRRVRTVARLACNVALAVAPRLFFWGG